MGPCNRRGISVNRGRCEVKKTMILSASVVAIGAAVVGHGNGVAQAGSQPNVVGQKYSDAASQLSTAGLSVVVSTTVGDTVLGRTASSLTRKAGRRRRRRTRALRRSIRSYFRSTAARRWPRRRPRITRSQVLKAGPPRQPRPRQPLLRARRPLNRQCQPSGLVVTTQRHGVTESPMAAGVFARVWRPHCVRPP